MNSFACQAMEYGICSVDSGKPGTLQNQLLPYIEANNTEWAQPKPSFTLSLRMDFFKSRCLKTSSYTSQIQSSWKFLRKFPLPLQKLSKYLLEIFSGLPSYTLHVDDSYNGKFIPKEWSGQMLFRPLSVMGRNVFGSARWLRERFDGDKNYRTQYLAGSWFGGFPSKTGCFLTSSFAPPSGKTVEYSFEGWI